MTARTACKDHVLVIDISFLSCYLASGFNHVSCISQNTIFLQIQAASKAGSCSIGARLSKLFLGLVCQFFHAWFLVLTSMIASQQILSIASLRQCTHNFII
jgi:hypothetical protein